MFVLTANIRSGMHQQGRHGWQERHFLSIFTRLDLVIFLSRHLPFSTAFVSIQPMLKIRLQRVGRKHEPSFRLVLTDSKNGPKSGKYQEVLGWYDVRRDNKIDQIKIDRIKYWMSKGAQVSDTVHNFLVENKIVEGKKINKLPRKSPIKKEEPKVKGEKKAEAAKPAEAKVETKSEAKAEVKVEAKSETTPVAETKVETKPEPTPEVSK
jgi:small subunit ribosomal protein S16